jgi:hypothetical protein
LIAHTWGEFPTSGGSPRDGIVRGLLPAEEFSPHLARPINRPRAQPVHFFAMDRAAFQVFEKLLLKIRAPVGVMSHDAIRQNLLDERLRFPRYSRPGFLRHRRSSKQSASSGSSPKKATILIRWAELSRAHSSVG